MCVCVYVWCALFSDTESEASEHNLRPDNSFPLPRGRLPLLCCHLINSTRPSVSRPHIATIHSIPLFPSLSLSPSFSSLFHSVALPSTATGGRGGHLEVPLHCCRLGFLTIPCP